MTGLFLCAGPAVSCCRRLRAGNSIATVLSSLPKAVLELKRRTWSARKIISGSMRKSDPVRLQRSDVAWAERSLRALRQNEDKLVSMLAERRVAQHRWAESVLAAVDASFAAGRLQTIPSYKWGQVLSAANIGSEWVPRGRKYSAQRVTKMDVLELLQEGSGTIAALFDQYSTATDAEGGKRMGLSDWLAFCRREQGVAEEAAHEAVTLFAAVHNAFEELGEPSSQTGGRAEDSAASAAPAVLRCATICHEQFTTLLLGRANTARDDASLASEADDDAPLAHYWVAASHNSYLEGDQLASPASSAIYRRLLLLGCRSLEIDCWDGPDGEPIVTHGGTLCGKVSFDEVVTACAETAFVRSRLPVMLGLEMHCSPPQQVRCAAILRERLGSRLLLPEHLQGETAATVSLRSLHYRFLVKGKIRPMLDPQNEFELSSLEDVPWVRSQALSEESDVEEEGAALASATGSASASATGSASASAAGSASASTSAGAEPAAEPGTSTLGSHPLAPPRPRTIDLDAHIPAAATAQVQSPFTSSRRRNSKSRRSSKAPRTTGRRSSHLMPVLGDWRKRSAQDKARPVHPELVRVITMPAATRNAFLAKLQDQGAPSADRTEAVIEALTLKSPSRCTAPLAITSFSEGRLLHLLGAHDEGEEGLWGLTQQRIARIFPRGTRTDSSNLDPLSCWRAGMQHVALNLQTNDLPSQLHRALFARNGGRGYVRKPPHMLRDSGGGEASEAGDGEKRHEARRQVIVAHDRQHVLARNQWSSRRLPLQAVKDAGHDLIGTAQVLVTEHVHLGHLGQELRHLGEDLAEDLELPIEQLQHLRHTLAEHLPHHHGHHSGAPAPASSSGGEQQHQPGGLSSRRGSNRVAWEPVDTSAVTLDVLRLHQLPAVGEARPDLTAPCHAYVPALSGAAAPPGTHRTGVRSPVVSIEIYTADGSYCSVTPYPLAFFCGVQPPANGRHSSPPVQHNGLGPRFDLHVRCLAERPENALVRIVVTDGGTEVAYECLPLSALRAGYRALALRDATTGTRIELCTLLIHVTRTTEPLLPRNVPGDELARLMSVWASAHVAYRATATLQSRFRMRRRRRKESGVTAFEDTMREARARIRRTRRTLTAVWICWGLLVVGAAFVLLSVSETRSAFTLLLSICGGLFMLMAVLPTDKDLVALLDCFGHFTVVSGFVLCVWHAAPGTKCAGLAHPSSVHSCTHTFYYVCCGLIALCLLLCRGVLTLCTHRRRSTRQRLGHLWAAMRGGGALCAAALAVRTLLPLAEDSDWARSDEFASGLVEVALLWLVCLVLTPYNRGQMQTALKRLSQQGDVCAADYVASVAGAAGAQYLATAQRAFPSVRASFLREADFRRAIRPPTPFSNHATLTPRPPRPSPFTIRAPSRPPAGQPDQHLRRVPPRPALAFAAVPRPRPPPSPPPLTPARSGPQARRHQQCADAVRAGGLWSRGRVRLALAPRPGAAQAGRAPGLGGPPARAQRRRPARVAGPCLRRRGAARAGESARGAGGLPHAARAGGRHVAVAALVSVRGVHVAAARPAREHDCRGAADGDELGGAGHAAAGRGRVRRPQAARGDAQPGRGELRRPQRDRAGAAGGVRGEWHQGPAAARQQQRPRRQSLRHFGRDG